MCRYFYKSPATGGEWKQTDKEGYELALTCLNNVCRVYDKERERRLWGALMIEEQEQ